MPGLLRYRPTQRVVGGVDVASSMSRERDTEPSRAMKSTTWPASPVYGLSFTFTVSDAHSMRCRDAEALLASVKDAGV